MPQDKKRLPESLEQELFAAAKAPTIKIVSA